MNSRKPTCWSKHAVAVLCATVGTLVATTGCQSKRQQRQSIDALHKELRLQEDQIYQLQDAIEEYQDALAHCRAGGRPAADAPGFSSPGSTRPYQDNPAGVPELPRVELGDPDEENDLPLLENGPPSDKPPAGDDAPPVVPPREFPSRDPDPKPIDNTSAEVRTIRLHAVLTGGIDRDGQPGDEGIQVAIEPLDAEGKVVPATGSVAIALMDHTLPAGNQRLAFWTFDAQGAAAKVQRGGISDGLLFELMWGEQRYPTHRDLDVFVRYTTSDGRNLQTHQKVRIRLPEDVVSWKKTERLPATDERRPGTIRPVSGFEPVPPRER